jgi:hypothetical protein
MFGFHHPGPTVYRLPCHLADLALATTSRFGYLVNGFIDSQAGKTIDGMMYENYELEFCYVQSIVFTQYNIPTTNIQVLMSVFQGS